jgi:hypothetical protein
MDQKIFNIGLSVESISVYLLCCSLVDVDLPISTRNLMDRWNGTEKELLNGLDDLGKRKIIDRIISNGESQSVYKLRESDDWRCH